MYRIGLFSKITKVTVKALRFYEEEGLLTPEFTEATTGYRYYSSSQLPRVYKIVSLRQCGFSIPEIREILCGKNIASLFSKRKEAIEHEAIEASRQLAAINHYIDSLGEDSPMPCEVIVKEIPSAFVYSKRMVVASFADYFTIFPKLGEDMMAVNPELRCAEDPPYCFITYHDGEYRETDIDIEVCEAVTGKGNGRVTEGVIFKTIDRIPEAACVLHRGPYRTLPKTYATVFKWIDDNGYVTADCPRESYIDGIWNKDSEDDWLTEIQVPILR